MKSAELVAALKTRARELGFSTIGFIPARPARRLAAYLRWVDAGMHGQMGYMARPDRIVRRQDLRAILPGVQTLICVGLDYFTQRLPAGVADDPGRGRIANYAWGVDYHHVMTPRLERLAAWLRQTVNTDVAHRVYVDTGAILERDHAEQAGLGFTGKNTMLIHPRRGSFFFLGEILTTLEIGELGDGGWGLEGSGIAALQSPMPSCGTCRRCLDACPTNAFPEPYVLDARRCISYLTIELKGWIPRELRPLLGNWIYGCDICQDVCPFNRFAQPTHEKSFWSEEEGQRLKIDDLSEDSGAVFSIINHQSLLNAAAPSLFDLLQLDEADFNERYARSPIKRLKHGRFLRNVCVAAGNWGSETAVAYLIPLLAHPQPIVRGHAAWALHQIGGDDAEHALAAALAVETDPAVRRELAQEAGGDDTLRLL